VHGATVLRMWVTNESGVARFLIFRLFEQGFQLSGGPIDKEAFDAAWH
jgi:hypothetical protein